VFYGAFAGRAKIAEMIDDWFYRTAKDFRWDMHDPVSDGKTLYARYTFSYRSLLPEANGGRVMFEGVAFMSTTRRGIGDLGDTRDQAVTQGHDRDALEHDAAAVGLGQQ